MKTLSVSLLLISAYTCFAQLNNQLFDSYEQYVEQSVKTRRFKHEDIMKVLDGLGSDFNVRQVGTSVEGRAIKLVSIGSGPVNVLMWSQMHGDETTATRSIMDVFRWLAADDQYNPTREKIKSSITWHFMPMLNPDGASRFTRRNHYGIDINRDALRLQTPEGRTLKRVRDSLNADWGFNLHDQGRGTSVEGKVPATISLLAPAFDHAKTINEKRGDAMQLTRYMFNQITQYIPGQIGIYDDTFEPRAFGDNIQKWGTRTILIESGGYQDDWEKEEIRKLNFVLLITAADAIANRTYEKTPVKDYAKIPTNGESRIRDVILRNVTYEGLIRDIAIDRSETSCADFRHYYARASVVDLGDLSTSQAYFDVDAAGYEVRPGRVYESELAHAGQLASLDTDKLWKEGFTEFVVKAGFDPYHSTYPFNVHTQRPPANDEVRMGGNPSLLFVKDGRMVYMLVNGILHKVQ